jgi:hypothetical protein
MKAFPTVSGQTGMELRDYFAARIMHFLLSTQSDLDVWDLAKEAYVIADAMMEAREAK